MAASTTTATTTNQGGLPGHVLPTAPKGWAPAYSTAAFAKYSRRLKGNGQACTMYVAANATTTAHKRQLAQLAKAAGGTAAVYVATWANAGATPVVAGFAKWGPAYAYSVAQGTAQGTAQATA